MNETSYEHTKVMNEYQLEIKLYTEKYNFSLVENSDGKFTLKNRDTYFELFLCMKKWVFENMKHDSSTDMVNRQYKTEHDFRLPSVNNMVHNIKSVRRPFVDRLNKKTKPGQVNNTRNYMDSDQMLDEFSTDQNFMPRNLKRIDIDSEKSKSFDIANTLGTRNHSILKRMHTPVIKVWDKDISSKNSQDNTRKSSAINHGVNVKRPATPVLSVSQIDEEQLFDTVQRYYTIKKSKRLKGQEKKKDTWQTSRTSIRSSVILKQENELESFKELQALTCGDDGRIISQSINKKEIFTDWGVLHNCSIWSMCISKDEYYLWTGDQYGYQKQWCLNTKLLHKDFGKVHLGSIMHLIITNDNQYFFSSDFVVKNAETKQEVDVNTSEVVKDVQVQTQRMSNETSFMSSGQLISEARKTDFKVIPKKKYLIDPFHLSGRAKNQIIDVSTERNHREEKLLQWNVETGKIYRKWDKLHESPIFSLHVSADSKHQFTADKLGCLKQSSIKTGNLVKDYGKVHKDSILSMAMSYNNRYLFTADRFGYLNQWDIGQKKQVKHWGDIHCGLILSIAVTTDTKYVFTVDNIGYQMQWNLEEYKLEKDYGKVHDFSILKVEVSHCNKWAFTMDSKGIIKQWNLTTKTLEKDYGCVHTGPINSMVLTNLKPESKAKMF